jgi:hypothetical protein
MPKDWELTFQGWGKPPGKTEQDKCSNAETSIRVGASGSGLRN